MKTILLAAIIAAAGAAQAAAGCRPFLVAASFGGVAEGVSFERRCSAFNEPYWVMAVTRGGLKAEASSLDRPELRWETERRIKTLALGGLDQEAADLAVLRIGPLLAAAGAAGAAGDAAEKERLLALAAGELAAWLAN